MKKDKEKNSRFWFLVVLVFGLGILTRLMFLGQIPVSLNWDEAAIGYNAYSLMKTGRDEWGRRLPLFLRSFGDYKSAIPAYLAVPFIERMGLNILAVRLPTALLSISSVLACFWLSWRLTGRRSIGLIASLLFALSPWAIHFSHFSHEGTIAFVFMLWGLVFLFKEEPKAVDWLLAGFFFSLSLYAYHNVRLFLPLFIPLYLLIKGRKFWQKNWRGLGLFFGFMLVLLVPLFLSLSQGELSARVKGVSIFHSPGSYQDIREGIFRYTYLGVPLKRVFNNKLVYFSYTFIKKYLEHFSLEFLFLGREVSPRLGLGNLGKLYLIELPFLVYGLIRMAGKRKDLFLTLLVWIMLAPLASSLTLDSPHSLRTLIFLPVFQIVAAYGFIEVYGQFKAVKGKGLADLFSLGVLGLLVINFGYYLHFFYFFYPEFSAPHWQDGYQQLVDYVWPRKGDYQEVIVNKHLGQPHIFFAFWGRKDPADYQRQRLDQADFEALNADMGRLDNLIFKEVEREEDVCRKKALLVGYPYEFKLYGPPKKRIYLFNRFGKKEPVFDIVETEKIATSPAFLRTRPCQGKD